MTSQQSAPDAPAIRVRPHPTYPRSYTVWVHCPYCSGVHIHGGNGPGDEVGHRVPDCWSSAAQKINSAGYNVTVPADLEVEVQQ